MHTYPYIFVQTIFHVIFFLTILKGEMSHLHNDYPYDEENSNAYLTTFMGYLKRYHQKDLVSILMNKDDKLHYSIEVAYVT